MAKWKIGFLSQKKEIVLFLAKTVNITKTGKLSNQRCAHYTQQQQQHCWQQPLQQQQQQLDLYLRLSDYISRVALGFPQQRREMRGEVREEGE